MTTIAQWLNLTDGRLNEKDVCIESTFVGRLESSEYIEWTIMEKDAADYQDWYPIQVTHVDMSSQTHYININRSSPKHGAMQVMTRWWRSGRRVFTLLKHQPEHKCDGPVKLITAPVVADASEKGKDVVVPDKKIETTDISPGRAVDINLPQFANVYLSGCPPEHRKPGYLQIFLALDAVWIEIHKEETEIKNNILKALNCRTKRMKSPATSAIILFNLPDTYYDRVEQIKGTENRMLVYDSVPPLDQHRVRAINIVLAKSVELPNSGTWWETKPDLWRWMVHRIEEAVTIGWEKYALRHGIG